MFDRPHGLRASGASARLFFRQAIRAAEKTGDGIDIEPLPSQAAIEVCASSTDSGAA